jgi:hypothetical protein
MRNPLRPLLARFKPELSTAREPLILPALPGSEDIKAKLAEIEKPVPAMPATPRRSRGRVIKQTRHAEFNPDATYRGGRIVKVMPRKLQKLKAAQEMVEDDGDQPRIEDLED